MKWFMSYAQVYERGSFSFGMVVYDDDEHPLDKANRWNETYGTQDKFQAIVISFQRVPDDTPEVDTLSYTCP